MDFAKEARKLADEVLPENTSVKATLAFIEKVSTRLESVYAVAFKDGVKEGKAKEKERSSRHGSTSHADWCHEEDCLGQCKVR